MYDGSTEDWYDHSWFVPVISDPILVNIIVDTDKAELIEFNENKGDPNTNEIVWTLWRLYD